MNYFFLGLLLLLLGFCVIAAEMFLPSAGILGFIAAGLILTGVVFGFWHSLASGAMLLGLLVVALPVIVVVMIKVWPHTRIGKKILLDELTPEDVLPNSSHYSKTASLKGQLGVAKSKMLPSGQILVNGEKYDAVSEGFPIEAGDKIKVIDVRQNRIFVEPYDGDEDVNSLPATDRGILSQSLEELGIDPIDDPLA